MNRVTSRLLAAMLLCIAGAGGPARAADYPTRPVRWIVPYPPAGTTDVLARIIAQWLSEKLGQTFIVENKPGGGNNVGTETVVNAPPDGYTMLLANPANGINATLYKNLNFNFIRDIAPVAGIVRTPNVMVVTPTLPVKTVAEFIAYCKANPGKLNMASSGAGTSVHLSGELFKSMTGCQMVHVPYKGAGPALIDLMGGQVQVHVRQPAVVGRPDQGGQDARAGGDHAGARAVDAASCRPSARRCPATRRRRGSASACPRARRATSSRRSTPR